MKKFDTKVQYIKYQVSREVAKYYWDGTLSAHMLDLPSYICPDKTPSIRCCVYKERAIITERIKIAMGGRRGKKNPIEVIPIACDECPVGGYEVTVACRGCLAHRCKEICKPGAITFDHNHTRPCQNACKVNAITINANNVASIDDDKCISCGSCVYQCPFGAIVDQSHILTAIDLLKRRFGPSCVYAIIAPSIASQYPQAQLPAVITGIKQLGFTDVIEAAAGAELTAYEEANEWKETGFLMNSCCPAFVEYVEKEFPQFCSHLSQTPSPMVMAAKLIKSKQPKAKIIFIGPCTAKKLEIKKAAASSWIDVVLTFEELQALFDSQNINLSELEGTPSNSVSYYGRIFGRTGGLSTALKQALLEQNFDSSLFDPCICNGIEECKKALLLKQKGVLTHNYIEGMACKDGCIGGAGCLTHSIQGTRLLEAHGMSASKIYLKPEQEEIL